MRPRARRIAVGAALASTVGCVSFGVFAFSVLSAFFIEDIGVTRAQIGWLVTAFGVTAGTVAPRMGRMSDAVGGRAAIIGAFAVAAAGLVLIGLAPTFAVLFGAAVVAGLAKATGDPAANRVIVDAAAPGARGMLTGVKQSGVHMAGFLAGIWLPFGAIRFGWRPTLIITAFIPLAMIAVAWLLFPEERRENGRRPATGPLASPPKRLGWLTVYGLLMGATGGVVFTYLPIYSQEELGFTVSQAGLIAGMVSAAGVVSRIGWTRISEVTWRTTGHLAAISASATVGVVLMTAAPTVGAVALWMGSIIAGAAITAWNPVALLMVMADAAGATAQASGRVLFGMFIGAGIAPPAFGYSVDLLGDYRPGLIVVTALVAAAGVLAWSRHRRFAVTAENGVSTPSCGS